MKLLATLIATTAFLFATVDLNSATVKDLTQLSGIGLKKAEAIVKYRDSIRCFKSVDELENVKGIGKATVSKNRDNIELGECKVK